MASSAFPTATGIPSPPPPTPSNQSLSKTLSIDDNALSRLLDQLLLSPPPPLSRLRGARFGKRNAAVSSVPLVSLLEPRQDLLTNALDNHGYFHLTDHGIPSLLPSSALLEFSNSPFDNAFLTFGTSSEELDAFPATKEYARGLERVGLEVVGMMFPTENPFREGTIRPRCLMWISNASASRSNKEYYCLEKCYPYVVCLQYVTEGTTTWVVGDSGARVAIEPRIGSVLVTIGDIAKVWSNGRFKKVRGKPDCNPLHLDENNDDSRSVSMSMLVTLPVESIVSPFLPPDADEDAEEAGFRAFPFEEYA